MKKTLILFACLLSANILSANIFTPSGAQISELLWDENGDWQLEISYYYIENPSMDSIFISTKNYQFKAELPVIDDYRKGYYVLNKEICDSLFDLNSSGDSIFIKTYSNGVYFEPSTHYLIFGDYKNSMIDKPQIGKSIALFEGIDDFFTISNKPTLGSENTFAGAFGVIKGTIYNNNNALNKWCKFGLTFMFRSNVEGKYLTYLLQKKYSINNMYYRENEISSFWIDIQEIAFDINIDDTVEIDINITDPDFTNIPGKRSNDGFTTYPNPVANRITIESKRYFKYKTVQIQIVDVKGKEVATFLKPLEEQILIELDSKIKSGIYVLNILGENQLVYSEKIIVNSFK